ncbi:MAG: hypothetical protein EAY81_04995 [Bacteroidetes bacterium]|nr:MAG: hypothetical protein EAY81_04995 [Bacteroidota bacterium]
MKRIALFIIIVLGTQGLKAQHKHQDSLKFRDKISLGIGAFVGLSYLFGQPDGAYTSTGSNFGFMAQTSYSFTPRLSISTDFRWCKSEHVLKLRVGVNPDFFIMNTTTLQVPIFVSYVFHSKQNKPLLGINIGASYNWNTYNTIYENVITTWPSTVASKEITKKSHGNDYSIMIGVFKNVKLNKKGSIQMRMFNEYQLNLYTSRFRNRVVDPIYLVSTNQDKFTPLFIRCGTYINFSL